MTDYGITSNGDDYDHTLNNLELTEQVKEILEGSEPYGTEESDRFHRLQEG
jgi:hypothetical protein